MIALSMIVLYEGDSRAEVTQVSNAATRLQVVAYEENGLIIMGILHGQLRLDNLFGKELSGGLFSGIFLNGTLRSRDEDLIGAGFVITRVVRQIGYVNDLSEAAEGIAGRVQNRRLRDKALEVKERLIVYRLCVAKFNQLKLNWVLAPLRKDQEFG
jgi:hypothetical protein